MKKTKERFYIKPDINPADDAAIDRLAEQLTDRIVAVFAAHGVAIKEDRPGRVPTDPPVGRTARKGKKATEQK